RVERHLRLKTRQQNDAVARIEPCIHLNGLAGRMKERKRYEHCPLLVGMCGGSSLHYLVRYDDVRKNVEVRQFGSLRLTGRTGSVKDRAGIVRRGRPRFEFGALTSDERAEHR